MTFVDRFARVLVPALLLFAFSGWLPAFGHGAGSLNSGKDLPSSKAGFVENRGQVVSTGCGNSDAVRFVRQSGGMNMYFTRGGVSYVFKKVDESGITAVHRTDMIFNGANPNLTITASGDEGTDLRYYLGMETTISTRSHSSIIYKDVYPNIDIRFYGDDNGVKYDFIVHPGGRVSDISFSYAGANDVCMDKGGLLIRNSLGELHETAPVSYQDINDQKSSIASAYRFNGKSVSFEVGEYDASETLIIDPGLIWATYFGGTNLDVVNDLVQDASGNVFVTGYAISLNFPVSAGAFQTVNAGSQDAYVAKLDANGQRMWATYIGGTSSDNGMSIALDAYGNAIISGQTSSNNFPVSPGAFQTAYQGGIDAFVAQFNGIGQRIWASYLGGTRDDISQSVCVDAANNIIVTGSTNSVNFPVSVGAYQTTNAGTYDACVTKFRNNGAMIWSTYIGGVNDEVANSSVTNSAKAVIIAGQTSSPNFPVTTGTMNGTADAFVMKLDSSGGRLWSVFYGGSSTDAANGIAIESTGNVVVVGTSYSSTATGPNPWQASSAGGTDAFLARFNGTTGQRLWATYYGGGSDEAGLAVAVDSYNNSIFTGRTNSANFPVTANAFQTVKRASNDAFVVKFNSAGQRLWSTLYGGDGDDRGTCVAIELNGNNTIGGSTTSTNLPVANSWQAGNAGTTDGFVTKFCDFDPVITVIGPNPVCQGDVVILDAGPGFSSYNWSTGAGTQTITVNTTGDYWCTVVGGMLCTRTSDTVHITVYNRPYANAGTDVTICSGGSATIGTPHPVGLPYKYSWSPTTGLSNSKLPQTTVSRTNTTLSNFTHIYVLTVTDTLNGCTKKDTVLVTVHPAINLPNAPDAYLCPNATVQIGSVATGGTGALTYSWTPATGLSSASVAQPFASPHATITYTLTVTDALGCTAQDQVTVVVNTLGLNAGIDRPICAGSSIRIGQPASGGTPPYTYSWSPMTGIDTTGSPARPSASPTTTTKYIVTATDQNSCSSKDTITVLVYPNFKAYAGPDTVYICNGSGITIGDTVVCGSGSYLYSWSPAASLNNFGFPHPYAAPGATTTYVVTVTDNVTSAVTKDTITVVVNPTPVVTLGVNKTICYGSTEALSATVIGGTPPFQYYWTPATGLSSTSIQNPNASPDDTITYTVIVTDANGCQGASSLTINVLPELIANAGPDRHICIGSGTNIGSPATGGSPGYSYLWAPATGLNRTDQATVMASPTVTTDYIVTVSDSRGCSVKDTVRVQVHPLPTIVLTNPPPICGGTPVIIGDTATGGMAPYRYSWSPRRGLNDSTLARPTARPLVTTVYTVVVTDALGCQTTGSVIVTAIPAPVANAGPDKSLCYGQSTTIGNLATGGLPPYSYQWTPSIWLDDSLTAQPMARPLGTVNYILTVTDLQGCQSRDTVRVTVNTSRYPLVQAGGPTTFCHGDSLLLACDTGFVSYHWTTGETTSSIYVKTTGMYSVTTTDHNGCSATSFPLSISVLTPETPVLIFHRPLSFCRGDSTIIEIKQPPTIDTGWTYIWSNGTKGRFVTIKDSGVYYCAVTPDNGCTVYSPNVTVSVTEPFKPLIVAEGPTQFCVGSSVVLDAGDGYAAYLWSTGERTRKINVTKTGQYSVTASNSTGCQGVSDKMPVFVGPLSRPKIKVDGKLLLCYNTTVHLYIEGNWSNVQWNTGIGSSDITVGTAGKYWLTAADPIGCYTVSDTVEVQTLPRLIPRIYPEGEVHICEGQSLVLSSDSGYAEYSWSTLETTREITVTQSGSYILNVTDIHGCTGSSRTTVVYVHTKPNPVITPLGPTTICEEGVVDLDAGAGYASYLWSNGSTTRTISVSIAGDYTVTVSNDSGCTATSAPVTVTVNASPKPVITPPGPVTLCEGDSVILDAGAGFSTYTWSNGGTKRRAIIKTSGLYNVRVTNAEGCRGESQFVSVTVNPAPPVPTITRVQNTLTSSAAQGYQWYRNDTLITGATGQSYNATKKGTYKVTIFDVHGCKATSAPFPHIPVGIENIDIPFSITVWPDPNHGEVNLAIDFDQPTSVEVRVTDLLGRDVAFFAKELPSLTYRRTISLDAVPVGMYFLNIQAGDRLLVKKIVKER